MPIVLQALKQQKEAWLEAHGSAQQLQHEREELKQNVTRLEREKSSLHKAQEKVGLSVRPYRSSSPSRSGPWRRWVRPSRSSSSRSERSLRVIQQQLVSTVTHRTQTHQTRRPPSLSPGGWTGC